MNFLRFAAAPEVRFHHNPNENKLLSTLPVFRRMMLMKKMHMLGLQPGILDISLFWYGCYAEIELKAGKNKPDDNQIARMADIKRLGFQSGWCNNLASFITMVKTMKVPLRHRSGIYAGIQF